MVDIPRYDLAAQVRLLGADSLLPPDEPKRSWTAREGNLQTQIVKWARECVRCKHKFKAFDRSKNTHAPGSQVGRHFHEWQKGVRRGTLDTCLITEPNAVHRWVELKAPGVVISPKDDDAQLQEIADIRALGGFADWTNSVVGYARLLEGWGVPLYPMAMVRALDLDLLLAGKRMKSEGLLPKRKRKSSGKPRKVAPTAAGLRFGATRNRLGGLF